MPVTPIPQCVVVSVGEPTPPKGHNLIRIRGWQQPEQGVFYAETEAI